MIALITTTGAREESFKLCAKWMKRQTYTGEVKWIIVDDALPCTTDSVGENFKENWDIVKIYPSPVWHEGENTQGRNIKAAVDFIKKSRCYFYAIFIIEDDDFYKPTYIEEMMRRMEDYDLIGETHTIYYNVVSRYYFNNNNEEHCSLFQTAFTPRVIPILEASYGEKFIDCLLWRNVQNKLLFRAGNLAIGMKGMPGRFGIGAGHKLFRKSNDEDMRFLKKEIKSDAKHYEEYFGKYNQSRESKVITISKPNVPIDWSRGNINNLPI